MDTLDYLLDALNSESCDVELQPFDFKTQLQNQMLFFIKPEAFLVEGAARRAVCQLIFDRIAAFGMEISGAYLMSAETLDAEKIMDRHYGYINRVSREGSRAVSQEHLEAIWSLCSMPAGTPVRGGHEVLAEHPSFSAASLDRMWATKKSKRVQSGLYVESYELDGRPTIIANGFHPFQLEHFTSAGRKICLLLLNSDLPWPLLRKHMLGDTFPEKANAGSIRGTLNRHAQEYGFTDVTIANNCAHMSAGAFEAVFELKNFLSGSKIDFRMDQCRMADHFRAFGLAPASLDLAIDNPELQNPLAGERLFSVTEECDASSAAAVFGSFVGQAAE